LNSNAAGEKKRKNPLSDRQKTKGRKRKEKKIEGKKERKGKWLKKMLKNFPPGQN